MGGEEDGQGEKGAAWKARGWRLFYQFLALSSC